MKIIKIMVPAGEYYIGDPGLVFSESDWKMILDENSDDTFVFKVGEKGTFLMFSVGGDGDFSDVSNKKYPVDSGSIGLVPVGLINGSLLESNPIIFKKATLCKYIEDELLSFGDTVFNLGAEIDFEYEKEVEGRDYWQVWE